jgi:uncharacterized protein
MNTVSYFEIQADDCERAVAFYKDIFGWEFTKEENLPIDYYRIKTDGMNGGLLKRPARRLPGQENGTNAFVCSVMVENFDTMAKEIVENGGVIALPKFAVPSVCWQGYFLDTEGNTFGIFEVDEKAK